MNFLGFLRKENNGKRNWNQNQKKKTKPSPGAQQYYIVARLAIQGYAECLNAANLLPSVKRGRGGGKKGERGKREEERKGKEKGGGEGEGKRAGRKGERRERPRT